MKKPCIELWAIGGWYFIAQCESGVRYSNQTGGLLCAHPEVEGVLVPIRNINENWGKNDPLENHSEFEPESELERVARIANWLEWAELDEWFEPAPSPGEVMEAWVPVRVKPFSGAYGMNQLRELTGMVGIITYPNSD